MGAELAWRDGRFASRSRLNDFSQETDVPVCPNCGVAYLDGEFHECWAGQTTWRALWGGIKVVLMVCGTILVALIVLVIGLCGGLGR